jgi:acylphosphatase
MRTLHILAEGRVQGVGYREFVRRTALRHHVNGWVRNRFNGKVEARVSGAAQDLDTLVGAMRIGPPAAQVRGLQVNEDGGLPETGGFTIVQSY